MQVKVNAGTAGADEGTFVPLWQRGEGMFQKTTPVYPPFTLSILPIATILVW
jgi:hypothetical protein